LTSLLREQTGSMVLNTKFPLQYMCFLRQ
jgi:hypothetical protein